jgi:hypothetical protein
MQNYNLVVVPHGYETWSDIKGGMQTESIREQSVEENVWIKKEQNGRRMEKTAHLQAS